ncbi:M23 family metallopeptidase [Rhodobacteraceae bacterium M382]|nr:M23 family metallopeptidase [Rhodobacteraceae bacterium M382]
MHWLFIIVLSVVFHLDADRVQATELPVTLPYGAPKIISDFHSRRGVKGRRRGSKHQGIDIGGPNGAPILAAADGVVVETDIGTCWGPTIVIDHGADRSGKPLIAAYGHLGDILVKTGQTVTRGQRIARLSNNFTKFRCISGVRHLHFQIGRSHRSGPKGSYWGHIKYLKDGKSATNPHLFWADGPGQVTCFRPATAYPKGTLTYPVPCR